MSGDRRTFFSVEVETSLVSDGRDYRLPRDRNTRDAQHTLFIVYPAMLLQICRLYPGLPDARTLRAREIRFFYEGLREGLKQQTAPRT